MQIDDEIRRIITECSDKAEKVIRENIDKLHEVANYLIEHEKMSAETFELVMKGEFVEQEEEQDDDINNDISTEATEADNLEK